MIYPNAAKDRETSDYPYVELFRDLAAAVCRPNSTLITYGYSFGDEHINRVIRDMLTVPSTHLVIIAYNDPLGRIMQTYQELGRPSQISLLIGPALADLQILTESFLPKAAIDKTTFRMSELLKQRFGTKPIQARQQRNLGAILMGRTWYDLSPLAYADSLRIGSIDFVSPDEIKVLLTSKHPTTWL
jgi:hypothetical protein